MEDGEEKVCDLVMNNGGEEISIRKEIEEVLSAQGKEIGEIMSNVAALSAQMTMMMNEFKKSRYRAQSPSPRREHKQGYYHCGELGHFKRECP